MPACDELSRRNDEPSGGYHDRFCVGRTKGCIVTKVTATTVPDESALKPTLADADFYDAYEAPLNTAMLSPTEIFLRASRSTPRWVDDLMAIRNHIVRLFGLKDVGALKVAAKAPDAYEVGDRLGIFSIFGKTEKELLLGIDDRHLDVRVSVLKSQRNGLPHYVVSTVVHVHNLLGRVYMAPVGRIHPFVVRSMMGRAEV
ncbi:MAG: DUF2867 domain-containing protein [Bradyrhizobium sp.]|nr:MAG: DUF2867 domain-containing protein [Bradyrhizobium sp.]